MSWPERIPRRGKKRGQEKKRALGETKGLTMLRTRIVGCVPTPLRIAMSVPAQRVTIRTWLIRTNMQEDVCVLAYDQHPWDWPKNNVLGKVWLAEPSYSCFHPGAMVGLRKDGVLDKTEK